MTQFMVIGPKPKIDRAESGKTVNLCASILPDPLSGSPVQAFADLLQEPGGCYRSNSDGAPGLIQIGPFRLSPDTARQAVLRGFFRRRFPS